MTAHLARKRFGQHFLHDPNAIERILRCLNPATDDNLVEIGPGLGALTVPLLPRGQGGQAHPRPDIAPGPPPVASPG